MSNKFIEKLKTCQCFCLELVFLLESVSELTNRLVSVFEHLLYLHLFHFIASSFIWLPNTGAESCHPLIFTTVHVCMCVCVCYSMLAVVDVSGVSSVFVGTTCLHASTELCKCVWSCAFSACVRGMPDWMRFWLPVGSRRSILLSQMEEISAHTES